MLRLRASLIGPARPGFLELAAIGESCSFQLLSVRVKRMGLLFSKLGTERVWPSSAMDQVVVSFQPGLCRDRPVTLVEVAVMVLVVGFALSWMVDNWPHWSWDWISAHAMREEMPGW